MQYRFAVSEISAITGRHYCRSAKEAQIAHIQNRHSWMEPLLPKSYRYNRTTTVVPKAVRERLKTQAKISDGDLAKLADEVTVVTKKIKSDDDDDTAPLGAELLKELWDSPPKRKRSRLAATTISRSRLWSVSSRMVAGQPL